MDSMTSVLLDTGKTNVRGHSVRTSLVSAIMYFSSLGLSCVSVPLACSLSIPVRLSGVLNRLTGNIEERFKQMLQKRSKLSYSQDEYRLALNKIGPASLQKHMHTTGDRTVCKAAGPLETYALAPSLRACGLPSHNTCYIVLQTAVC